MPMQIVPYNLVVSSDAQRSPELDVQKLVNWYIVLDQYAPKVKALNPTPGTEFYYQFNDGKDPVRKLYVYRNSNIAVVGNKVYLYNLNENATPIFASVIGNIKTNIGFVCICNNNEWLMITDGVAGYAYNFTTGVFSQILTVNGFTDNPFYCAYFNSFFVVCTKDSNQWQTSAENDPTNWIIIDSPNISYLSYKADTFQGIAAINQRLLLFGNYIAETWYSGSSPVNPQFPYLRDNNAVFEFGCAASQTIATGFSSNTGVVVWLRQIKDGISAICMTDGSQITKISTSAIDWAIQQYSIINDAYAFCFNIDGLSFYEITFPTQNVTWLANITTLDSNGQASWSNLEMLDGSAHAITSHAYNGTVNSHFVGSSLGPYLLKLKSSVNTNFLVANGAKTTDPIKRYAIGSIFYTPNYDKFIIHQFIMDFETGVGILNSSESNPVIFFSASYDNGHTYRFIGKSQLGKQGDYNLKQIFYNLGISRRFIAKIESYDAVRMYLIGSSLLITPLPTFPVQG